MKNGHTKKTGKTSVRRRWLISYIVVMMIPILCSLLAYFASYSLISEEIRAANSLSLISAQSAIDSRLIKMQEMSLSVLRDPRFREVALVRTTEQERYWRVGDIMTQLFNYRASSLNMDILVYIPALDYAITPDVAYTLDLLSSSIHYAKNAPITAESWRASILTAVPNAYTVSSELSYNRYGADALVYCSNLSTLYQPGCYEAKVFISMQTDEILPGIALHEESAFLILDLNGEVLYADDPSFTDMRISFDNDTDQYQVMTLGGEKYACMFNVSGAADFVYAVITPYRHFWSRSYYINTIMFIGLAIASVIGLAVSVRLLFINYGPLRVTLDSLPDGGDENKNEFERINEQLSILYTAQSAMRVNLTRQQQYVKEYYLGMLLQGNTASLSDDDIIESLELDLIGKRLVPVFISVDNEDNWAVMQSEYKDADSGHQSVSLSAAIENVLRERLPMGMETLKTRSEDMIIIVCIAPPEMDEITKGIEDACEYVCAYFQKNLKMSLHAVIGTEAGSMDELPAVYRQVFPLRSFNTAAPQGGRVMHAAPYIMPAHPLVSRTESYISLLYDAVRLRSYSDSQDILHMLFRELDALNEPPTVKRYFLFELTNRLYGVSGQADGKRSGEDAVLPCMERLTAAEAPEEMYEAFGEYIRLLCDTGEAEPESGGRPRLHLRVQAYVHENYTDSNLSLAQIAHSVGMSPQYVSKLYKLETGQGLLDFINTVRIARAKEILEEEQIAISDLALRVGYTNVKTFRRAFQKIEGVNPGSYKGG